MGSSSGEGNGNPLQYSRLENSMGREAWWATVRGGHRAGHDGATSKGHSVYTSSFKCAICMLSVR